MHTNKDLNILLLSDSDFSNSIKELKEELSFKISFLPDKVENLPLNAFNVLLIQSSFIEKKEKLLSQIKKNNILKIFLFSGKLKKDYERLENIKLPTYIYDFNNKILISLLLNWLILLTTPPASFTISAPAAISQRLI